MIRTINASRSLDTKMKLKDYPKVEVYSFFPIDKHNCACQSAISNWKNRLAALPDDKRKQEVDKQDFLECPEDKLGKNRYEVRCNGCKAVVGYCWASDERLLDWVDFHYVQWAEKARWYGCLTPHVSPIDESLCIECTCGVDTRDFRANMTLPGMTAESLERKNSIGRKFGLPNSKFSAKKVRKNILIMYNRK